MIDLSLNEIRRLMSHPDNIRNISLVVDSQNHASRIVDQLINYAGIRLSKRVDNLREIDESETDSEVQQVHDIDIKYIPVPLYAQITPEDVADSDPREISTSEYLINLVDCSDFVCLAPDGRCSALHNADGVIVVLNCMEGLSSQAEKTFEQALSTSLRPILFIDNLEQLLLRTELSLEDIYQHLLKLVDSINNIVTQHRGHATDASKLCPSEDNVIFGSAAHGWAFTIGHFAAISASNFNLAQTSLRDRLWGDWYFEPGNKKWSQSGDSNQRVFNQFVLKPLQKVYNTYEHDQITDLTTLVQELGMTPSSSEQEHSQPSSLKASIPKLLPIADILAKSIVKCLPSPSAAQRYRAKDLYLGSQEDEVYHTIRDCAAEADLMLRVSNVIPSQDKKTSYVIGRVFSGTVRAGMKVRIQGEDYVAGKKHDLFIKTIDSPVLLIGRNAIPVTDVSAGNFICLTGVADYISKGGTITTSESVKNIGPLSRDWNATVYCSVDVVEPKDLPSLISGLKMLTKCDTNLTFSITEAGDHAIRGFSEQHLNVRFKELEQHYAGVSLKVSEPYVGYRESVRQKSSMTALSKTPNKFSRFFINAEPLSEDLSRAIEESKITLQQNSAVRARTLVEEYGWNEVEARKIWAFGPKYGANVVVDTTRAVRYLNDIKDFFIMGFRWATSEGPIAEEPMRSIRFNILDVTLFSDSIHRGGGQVIPTARRVTYAATLLADPALSEPVYQVQIHAPASSMTQVASELVKRRGHVISQPLQTGFSGALSLIKAHVPVVESFGLTSAINDGAGPFITNLVFDHWQAIQGSPLDPSTLAGKIAVDVRTKKGLDPVVPEYTKFYDKL